jgi:hypothetical protein
VPPQTVRVAGAVPALVMAPHDLDHLGRRVARREQIRARGRVVPHRRPLVGVEGPRLRDDLRRHAQLAEIVDDRSKLEQLELVLREAQLATDAHADLRHALRMLEERVVALARPLEERVDQTAVHPVTSGNPARSVAGGLMGIRCGFHLDDAPPVRHAP